MISKKKLCSKTEQQGRHNIKGWWVKRNKYDMIGGRGVPLSLFPESFNPSSSVTPEIGLPCWL